MAKDNNSYDWKFGSLGGAVRIAINSGEDIAHLGELDKKLWTVLSCPVNGLEFCTRTLEILDTDKDGRVRIDEVAESAKWITSVVKNPDDILKGESSISLDGFNTENEEGAALKAAAEKVLKSLGLDKKELAFEDVAAYIAGVDERGNAVKEEAAKKEALSSPYGEKSEDAAAAFAAIKDKVDDFFIRCKMIDFDNDCQNALDISVDSIAAISGENLATCSEKIAAYPLARPSKEALLPLENGINPAWQGAFAGLKELILDVDYPGAKSISSKEWGEVTAKIDAYNARKAAIAALSAEALDGSLAAEREFIAPVERFVHLYRDFYRFLNNFVSMKDFYAGDVPAIFQAGDLYIDTRVCHLCVRVADMGGHADMASLSGMFIIYCDCTSKKLDKTMQIAAVMTEGDIKEIRPGKNGVFYDRDGNDWDATVTKVVDNPISVIQAFWSPYRKFANKISERIDKNAAEKESKVSASMSESASTINVPKNEAEKNAAAAAMPKSNFDIAKFAGIFAAIGMAVAYLTTALAKLVSPWYNVLIVLAILFICISGPSMFIAWRKLRKRNLGPLLNANGWAINSVILVNTKFGETLTRLAQYPHIKIDDPYAEEKTPVWAKIIIWLAVLAIVFGILYFTNCLGFIGLPLK